MEKKIRLIPLVLLLLSSATFAQEVNRRKLAAEVKTEFLHAWNGYKKYAWGHDDLKPLSKTYHDWYGQSLLMTPLDALDTMYLMGLNVEAAKTKQYILANLSFDKDIEVQNFEITIRLLGGLLTNYQLTGDKRFLNLAEDLGNRLLPVFNSPTGMPYRYVNLKTGKTRDAKSNPAETGTLLIEFGTLSKLTRKPIYYDKAKRALVETFKRRSQIGLVGEWINVETGEWANTDSHVSGAIDSYYEYLLKCWLLFGDRDCKRMWDESIVAINKYLADGAWYGHADMNTGARRVQESSFSMWKEAGIEPEEFDYRARKITSPGYPLRPEIIESTYYLYKLTGDESYLSQGEQMWRDFVEYCRTEDAYAALKSVVTKEKTDSMQSFLFAETFKYFYLLFAPPDTLDFRNVIFNTEAHPIRKFRKP